MQEGVPLITFQEFSTRIVNLARFITSDVAKICDTLLQSNNRSSIDAPFTRLCSNTRKLLVVLKDNYNKRELLTPAQALVVDTAKELVKLILKYSHIVKKEVVNKVELDVTYDGIFKVTKSLIASINTILKGTPLTEQQIKKLINDVRVLKEAYAFFEQVVKEENKQNLYGAAKVLVEGVNSLLVTSNEMGILEVSMEVRLKAASVGIMSAGKSALGKSTWDSVTAIVSMHQSKEDLWNILRDLVSKCALSKKMHGLDTSKIYTSSPQLTALGDYVFYQSAPTRMGSRRDSLANENSPPIIPKPSMQAVSESYIAPRKPTMNGRRRSNTNEQRLEQIAERRTSLSNSRFQPMYRVSEILSESEDLPTVMYNSSSATEDDFDTANDEGNEMFTEIMLDNNNNGEDINLKKHNKKLGISNITKKLFNSDSKKHPNPTPNPTPNPNPNNAPAKNSEIITPKPDSSSISKKRMSGSSPTDSPKSHNTPVPPPTAAAAVVAAPTESKLKVSDPGMKRAGSASAILLNNFNTNINNNNINNANNNNHSNTNNNNNNNHTYVVPPTFSPPVFTEIGPATGMVLTSPSMEDLVLRVTDLLANQYSNFRDEWTTQSPMEREQSVRAVAEVIQTTSEMERKVSFPKTLPPPPMPPTPPTTTSSSPTSPPSAKLDPPHAPPAPKKKSWKWFFIPSCFRPQPMRSVEIPPERPPVFDVSVSEDVNYNTTSNN